MMDDEASLVTTPARQLSRGGAVPLLTIFLILLIGIPSRLIIGPLGAAGTPAQVFGICLAIWWLAMRVANPALRSPCTQPVRIAMLVFIIAILASYIAAATRPITSEEMRSADFGMLSAAAWLGLLLAPSAIASRNQLDRLMRRIVLGGGCLASLGLLQFITKRALTNYIQIPGLTSNAVLLSISDRNGFTRPAGTAIHAIEFGAVLTMILPIALHYALQDHNRGTLRRWYPVAVMAFAIPISISRSAIVSTVIVLAIVIPTWTRSARRKSYATILGIMVILFLTVPGLLSEITGLFTGISEDSSAQSRTGSYSLAWEFVTRAPIFGRGFLTFLPDYRILDNQYLGMLIDTGVVGLLALLGLFVTGVRAAHRIRVRIQRTEDRQLARALMASVASAGASFALFDAFSFPMAAGMIFLLLGCIDALGRLTWADHDDLGADPAYGGPVPAHVLPAKSR